MSNYHIKMRTTHCEHLHVEASNVNEALKKAKAIAREKDIDWKSIIISKEDKE